MKLFKYLVFTLTLLMAFSVTALANEVVKKPLDEVFQNAVAIPFDYHYKVFINGQLTNIYGDYQLFQKNNRVLVPIRLIGHLVSGADRDAGYWEVVWNAQKPEEVVLKNDKLQRTVKLQVNSNIMYINNEAKTMDVPPQNINGRRWLIKALKISGFLTVASTIPQVTITVQSPVCINTILPEDRKQS